MHLYFSFVFFLNWNEIDVGIYMYITFYNDKVQKDWLSTVFVMILIVASIDLLTDFKISNLIPNHRQIKR